MNLSLLLSQLTLAVLIDIGGIYSVSRMRTFFPAILAAILAGILSLILPPLVVGLLTGNFQPVMLVAAMFSGLARQNPSIAVGAVFEILKPALIIIFCYWLFNHRRRVAQ